MSRRPQVPQSNVPNRRPRRPQVPQSSNRSIVSRDNQSIVSRDERRGRPRPSNQLVVAEERNQRPPSALVPHRPQKKRNPNALVAYEEPEEEPSYHDEYYDPPYERPLMAQFCQPRCCILLLLVLFFGLLLLIAIILLVMSLEKGDPDGIAGWTYPIPARDANGYLNDQDGDHFGTAMDAAGEFLVVTAPNRENPNGSTGAVFVYVWLGSYWAVYGNDGILTPPDLDYEPKTWVDFYNEDKQQTKTEKEANRVHFDNDSKNAVKIADNGDRVAIGVPSKNSVVLYKFTHPLKESDYMPSIVVVGPYEDAGRNIAISADGNRVALTALYNETLANMTSATVAPSTRYLEQITTLDMTNTTNTTNVTLPGVVLIYDYLEENQTWVPFGDPIHPEGQSATEPEGWGANMIMSNDGNTIAISNPTFENELGIVDVYRRNDTTGEYFFSTTWEGVIPGGQFGYAMSCSADGKIVAVTAPFFDTGRAAVFELQQGFYVQGGTWSQNGEVKGEQAGEWFGYAIDMAENGESMVVGAPKGNGNVGKMIIFDFVLGRWYPYTDMPQRDQYGKFQASGNYGASVTMTNNGDSVTIGAPNHTASDTRTDYAEFFDKRPKGMDLTGRTRPAHVLAEHPDGNFGR